MLSYCTHTGTKVCTFTFNPLKGFSACEIVMPEPEPEPESMVPLVVGSTTLLLLLLGIALAMRKMFKASVITESIIEATPTTQISLAPAPAVKPKVCSGSDADIRTQWPVASP